MKSADIMKKLNQIQDIPTLPTVVVKINEMIADQNVSVDKLCQVLSQDQAIVGKLLKLVNSAFFGLRVRVENVRHAVVILGINTVQNAVLSISVVGVLGKGGKAGGFDAGLFWKHSLAVAVTAQQLARMTGLCSPDDSFVAGILHDMGKMVLLTHFKEPMAEVYALMKKEGLPFLDAEQMTLGVNHTVIGAHLASKWRLPAALADSIRCHHSLSPQAADLKRAHLTNAANTLVNREFGDCCGEKRIVLIDPRLLGPLKKALAESGDWLPRVAPQIQQAQAALLGE